MSSGALDPIQNPEAWDTIIVGQTTSPGICKVSEFKRAHEFDVKKGKGTLGATITFVGRPPAKGSITFQLWTPEHFADWDKFRPLLKYDPTKAAVQAIDIYHPSLADIDINSVVVESIGNIVHEGQQLYSITVELLEYFPPPKSSAVSTPTGSRPRYDPSGATSTSSGDPVADAQQKEIAALLKQATAP
jgi:hypothetical protein